MSRPKKPLTLKVKLSDEEARDLAQFLRRVGFHDFRNCAQGQAEAHAMQNAAARVAVALQQAGFFIR